MDINATETFDYWLLDKVEPLIAELENDADWHREVYVEGCSYDEMFELSVLKDGKHLHFHAVRCLVPPTDYDIFDAYFNEQDVAEANLVSLVFSHFKGKFDALSYHTKSNESDILAALQQAGFDVTVEKNLATTLTVSTSQNDHA